MATASLISLTETLDSLGESVTVDRDAGIIRGVKILGLQSKNGREYLREAVCKAKPLYEGSACNVDHRAKLSEARSCRERFGVFRGVEQRADGCLYADLHYLKTHPMAESVCESAERNLKTFGMSHDVKGVTSMKGGRTVVEEIKSVASVDLVADPATTNGLFEGVQPDMELQEQVAKLQADVLKLTGDLTAEQAKAKSLQEKLDEAEKAKAENDRKAAILAAFTEHKVDRSKVPAGLLDIIESQAVDAAKKAIKDLAETMQVKAPRSVSGTVPSNAAATKSSDTKSFVASIT